MTREQVAASYGDDTAVSLDLLVGYCDEAAQLVDRGRESFQNDFILQRASEAILNRIGDTVRNRLPQELLDDYPDQPWNQIVSQRIRAAHIYHSLDYRMVWTTFCEHIARLRAYVHDEILGDPSQQDR